jgi:hypothetical protein
MRFKCVLTFMLSVCVVVLVHGGVAEASNDGRTFPAALHEQISRKYPSATLVSLADLSEDDRKFFQKDPWKSMPRSSEG